MEENSKDFDIEKMKNKSIKPGVYVLYDKNKKYFSFKKIAAMMMVGAVVIASAVGLTIKHNDDDVEVTSYISEHRDAITSENAKYKTGNGFAYNEHAIAHGIVYSGSPEVEMYNVYKDVMSNAGVSLESKINQLNRIVKTLTFAADLDPSREKINGFYDLDTWEEFLKYRGCVKDGSASNEMYEEFIKQYIDLQLRQEQFESTYGVGGF